MKREILNPEELSDALERLDDWTIDAGVLRKSYKFKNFAEALRFVNQVGALADAADHHPDLELGFGYARMALTTHDRGGITDVDIGLAASIDRLEA